MSEKVKYLTENGVRRLWAAIEQKFIDNSELTASLADIADDSLVDAEAMSNADIDAITGYVEPVSGNSEPNEEPTGDGENTGAE